MKQINWKQIGTLVATGAVGGAITLSGWMVAYNQGWVALNGSLPGSKNSTTDSTNTNGGTYAGGTVMNEGELTTEDIVKKVVPAVVAISGTDNVRTIFGTTKQVSGGSGFVVRKDGLIVTNKHVVSSDTAKYTVKLSTGKSYDATVQARDPGTDLALIKISATNLPVVELGNSASMALGQKVIAIGNTLGEYQNTVTTGIISGLDRSITAGDGMGSSEKLDGLIQTDAAINPGNSGGPLVNMSGQVIGINTAVDTQAQAVGFAIPINTVKTQIQTVSSGGEISRPKLGVRYIPITKEFAEANDMTDTEGALVARGKSYTDVAVQPGGPADLAGIKEGDILLTINNEKITEDNGLGTLLQKYKPGDTVTIQLKRQGLPKTVKVKLGKM
jgi:serine protease Do